MRSRSLTFLLACAACFVAHQLHAADITFQVVGQQATDAASDLAYSGTLDRAYAFGTANGVPLNGIVFTPFASNSHGDTTTLASAFTYSDGKLTGNYGTLVSNGVAHDLTPAYLQLNGLVKGANYAVTVIGMGLRARSDCCSAGAGYNNLFVSGDTPNGTGWIHWEGDDASSRNIRGVFTADSSGTQTLNFNLFGTSSYDPLTISANVNAVLLSYTAVPEPASCALVAASIFGLLFVRRHRIS
jgi:hypothetical protein